MTPLILSEEEVTPLALFFKMWHLLFRYYVFGEGEERVYTHSLQNYVCPLLTTFRSDQSKGAFAFTNSQISKAFSTNKNL